MLTAREWKEFYRLEREQLGETGLLGLFDQAPTIEAPPSGAIIFPHTRLSASGHLIAAAADAVVRLGRERVVALGVLHRRDRGDARERRIHGEEVEVDEFSLDNFRVLMGLAARRMKVPAPRIVGRFPFLTSDDPSSLAGLDELHTLIDDGAVLVATTDPIHHGIGYGTPAERCMPRESHETQLIAQRSITDQFGALQNRDYVGFLARANEARSDFRDVGPVLTELLREFQFEIRTLALVDYADVLKSAQPTWVAAALISVTTC